MLGRVCFSVCFMFVWMCEYVRLNEDCTGRVIRIFLADIQLCTLTTTTLTGQELIIIRPVSAF